MIDRRAFTLVELPFDKLRTTQRGFTLVELLVVVAIIALLLAMLLPAMNKAKEVARAASCAASQHQVGLAIQSYANDNRNALVPGQYIVDHTLNRPEATTWAILISRYFGKATTRHAELSEAQRGCPAYTGTPVNYWPAKEPTINGMNITKTGYGIAAFPDRPEKTWGWNRDISGLGGDRQYYHLSSITLPSQRAMVTDCHEIWTWTWTTPDSFTVNSTDEWRDGLRYKTIPASHSANTSSSEFSAFWSGDVQRHGDDACNTLRFDGSGTTLGRKLLFYAIHDPGRAN